MLRRTRELLQAALLIWQFADNCNALTGQNTAETISSRSPKAAEGRYETGWIGGGVTRIYAVILNEVKELCKLSAQVHRSFALLRMTERIYTVNLRDRTRPASRP